MFVEQLRALPQTLLEYVPGWRQPDQPVWQTLPPDYRHRLIETAKEIDGPWPIILARDYLSFTLNGDREQFEALYLKRRRMLNAFVLAECAETQGRYLDRIVDGVQLICEETGWQLPAHNTYVRDTPCLPLPNPDRPVLDLFAAETGALLAVLDCLVAEQAPSISPLISKRIQSCLQDRIITPYLNEHFWWMGKGDEPMNNWTAWCTQNVLLVAFLSPCSQSTRRAIVKKAAASLDAFLKDYGDDGACAEGVLYYRHAGLCLFNALSILSQVAPEAFMPLWREEKVRNIANFIAFMHVDEDRYFNFSDSSAKAGHCGAREYFFGQAVGSLLLSDFALNDCKQDTAPDLPEEINLFYRLQAALLISEAPTQTPVAPFIPDHYFPSIGLMVARDSQFSLAVKAGNNGDDHNHNDVGSVILYKNGQPMLIDVGVETYNSKTFSKDRYDIWTMQSGFHNLPSFNGVDQMAGEEFAAQDVQVHLSDTLVTFEMDISGAYPSEAGVRLYHRSVQFLKNEYIEITDCYDGKLPATLSLMFAVEPQLTANTITLPHVGTIRYESGGIARCETIEITDLRLLAAWPAKLYRVLLPLKSSKLKLLIQ